MKLLCCKFELDFIGRQFNVVALNIDITTNSVFKNLMVKIPVEKQFLIQYYYSQMNKQ